MQAREFARVWVNDEEEEEPEAAEEEAEERTDREQDEVFREGKDVFPELSLPDGKADADPGLAPSPSRLTPLKPLGQSGSMLFQRRKNLALVLDEVWNDSGPLSPRTA